MKYIFANWKMYLDVQASVDLAAALVTEDMGSNVALAVFPTALAYMDVKRVCGDRIALGAQNCAWASAGAYTGAISAQMYRSVGCAYVLLGHSERRHIFGETDTDIRKKMEAALGAGLIPVLCVGETKEEKENGKREYRLKKQLYSAFHDMDLAGREYLIAYEPVWAISANATGEVCLPADADDVHGWIQNEMKQYVNTPVRVLYGGSVDATTVSSYLSLTTVDGVLVGSASTKAESLLALVRAVR